MVELPHDVAVPGLMLPEQILAAMGDLEVAHEELRVAEEELAEQREQIERLVARHDSSQRWRDHLFGLLPMALLVTDSDGKIREANASAADLLGVRPVHLPGKPLIVYVDPTHRRRVRDLLGRLAHGEPGRQATVRMTPRIGEPVTVDLIALSDPDDTSGTLRWVVLPDAGPAAEPARPGPAGDGEPSAESLSVATALARMFTLPVEMSDQQRLLAQIALVVGSAVTGTTAVSITIGDPVVPDRVASDSVDAQVFDGMQLRLGEGPCVDAFRQEQAVVCTDVLSDPRWPRLAAAAAAQPVRSVLALPLRIADERTGVANLYSTSVGAFATHTVRVGEVVAAAVAAVLREASERASLQALVHHLERALSSRAVIEQAKGIVMAHHGGTADEAFARLVAYSSRQNIKLRELAASIVREHGTLPLQGW